MQLVEVEALQMRFRRRDGKFVHAVNGVSFAIDAGETLGLIGESGSGKSTLGRLVLGLLTPSDGQVRFAGKDLATLDARALRRLREELQVIFQEPLESLDPRMRVGAIIEEPLIIHRRDLSAVQRRRLVQEMLDQVGLDPAHAARYPAELSGGQQQRVGIARAIITQPRFIVLDEPTSSLDLSVRAAILDLLRRLQRERGIAYLFISHDIATVAHFCTRTAVMYLGQVVELGPTAEVLKAPQHPYTQALLSATLSADPREQRAPLRLRGDAPNPSALPRGCKLAGRCPVEVGACSTAPVAMRELVPGHHVACIRAGGDARN